MDAPPDLGVGDGRAALVQVPGPSTGRTNESAPSISQHPGQSSWRWKPHFLPFVFGASRLGPWPLPLHTQTPECALGTPPLSAIPAAGTASATPTTVTNAIILRRIATSF